MKKVSKTPLFGLGRSRLLVLVFSATILCRTYAAEEERQKLLTTEGKSCKIVYSVSRVQILSETNAWEPGSRPFPADLRALVVKAKQFLERTRETRAPLLPLSVSLLWTAVPVDDRHLAFADRCFVQVSFNSTTPEGEFVSGDELLVVILLDGTIAEAEIASGRLIYPVRKNESKIPDVLGEPK